MFTRLLANTLGFFEGLRGKSKTQIEVTAEKDKQRYAAFNIEHHRKYDGTFMLFGFERKTNQSLLLAETNNFILAQQWGDAYGCIPPDVSGYAPCTICC